MECTLPEMDVGMECTRFEMDVGMECTRLEMDVGMECTRLEMDVDGTHAARNGWGWNARGSNGCGDECTWLEMGVGMGFRTRLEMGVVCVGGGAACAREVGVVGGMRQHCVRGWMVAAVGCMR